MYSCVIYYSLGLEFMLHILYHQDSSQGCPHPPHRFFPGGVVNFQDTRVRKSNKHVRKSDFEVS